MKITNVGKNGEKIKDLSEITIREKDFPALYALIRTMNERRGNDGRASQVRHEAGMARSA